MKELPGVFYDPRIRLVQAHKAQHWRYLSRWNNRKTILSDSPEPIGWLEHGENFITFNLLRA